MNEPHGMTLKFVARSTGLGQSKIKMVLSRHDELQELPYSTKAGGSRVFFPAFVEWLAKYEGQEAAQKVSESQKSQPVTSVTDSGKVPALDAVALSSLIRETVAAVVRELIPPLVEAVKSSLPSPAPQLALPPPPELEPRDALRKIVGEYAGAHGRDFRTAWSKLYLEFELRTHRNIRQCARNRGLDTLDYCESECILGELLALAYSLYGEKEKVA